MWWCYYAKPRIQSFLKWKSSLAIKNKRSKIEFYMRCLRELMSGTEHSNEKYCEMKKYKALIIGEQRRILEGVKVRSRVEDRVGKENVTLFHMMKISKRNKARSINQISYAGETLSGHDKVTAAFGKFFTDLYKKPSTTNIKSRLSDFSPCTKTFGEKEKRDQVRSFSQDEILAILSMIPKNKSPGPDGLTPEFFIRFWDIIKDELTKMYGEILEGIELPAAFKKGIIVLIPKSSCPRNANDYRPISLLNSDYKIFMKCIKERVSKTLDKIISVDQTCLNKKNNIISAIVKYREATVNSSVEKMNRLLLSVDFDHAFDRISHEYLWMVMDGYGFHPRLINCLKNLYSHASSFLQVNRDTSKEVKIERGVRQGCPLSMILFVVAVEPLISHLRHQNIELGAFADDITLILKDFDQVARSRRIIDQFTVLSGSLLNFSKCEATELGPLNTHKFKNRTFDWFQIKTDIKVLGIKFSHNIHDMIKSNWSGVTTNLSVFSMGNRDRNLNIFQRVTFLNVFLLSKVWFLAQILPIPVLAAKRIASISGWFLWHKCPLRVSRTTVIKAKKCGGLGLIDPWFKSNALLIKNVVVSIRKREIRCVDLEAVGNPPYSGSGLSCTPHIKRFLVEAAYIPKSYLEEECISVKHLYNSLLRQNKEIASVIRKNVGESDINWSCVFENINNKVFDNEQKSLLYLLTHNAYPFRSNLQQRFRADSEVCDRCKRGTDNLKHRFLCFDQTRLSSVFLITSVKYLTNLDLSLAQLLNFSFSVRDKVVNGMVLCVIYRAILFILSNENNPNFFADFKSSLASCFHKTRI